MSSIMSYRLKFNSLIWKEKPHTLILGWSNKLGSVLKQLASKNKSVGGGAIIVLADRDKEEMEMGVSSLDCDYLGKSVICHSGSPLILADLNKVSVSKARAIIVLASDKNAEESDARALRIVTCLTGLAEGLSGHIVVEINDPNKERLFKFVGGDEIEVVVVPNVTGRLMVQCALQYRLAKVWEDILGFKNARFYVKRWPELTGWEFYSVLYSFPQAVPCGVKVASNQGRIMLNPDDTYVLQENDEIMVIADDDHSYSPNTLPLMPTTISRTYADFSKKGGKKVLFCGWRPHIHDMIMVLNGLVVRGSELWLFNEVGKKERNRRLIYDGFVMENLANIKLVHKVGNALIRSHLEKLPLGTFHSIFILADSSLEDSFAHLDSRSLMTLLLIREIKLDRYSNTSAQSLMITEILDSNTRNLVSLSPNLDRLFRDYVLPNELVSRTLALLAENRDTNRIFEDLFQKEGNEICVRPVDLYLSQKYVPTSFYNIMANARERHDIVIGYRPADSKQFIINPPNKSSKILWCRPRFSAECPFLVISKKSPSI